MSLPTSYLSPRSKNGCCHVGSDHNYVSKAIAELGLLTDFCQAMKNWGRSCSWARFEPLRTAKLVNFVRK